MVSGRSIRLLSLSILVGLLPLFAGCDSGGSNQQGSDQNQPPSASVSVSSSTVTVGDQVTLDGSASSDPDGDALSYNWSLQTPNGSNASLSDPSAEAPTFTPDEPGEYTANLEVDDGSATASDTASVSAEQSVVEIGSDIGSDRTLTPDKNYLVTGVICVENASTLTINPGVTIRFEANTGLKICGDGSALVAEGTAEDVITFTGTTDSKGFWKGIGFNSSNTNNVLKQAVIEDAGSEKLFAGATIDGVAGLQLKGGSTLALENSTVRNHSNNGLHADENVELRSFSSNLFTNNENASLHLHIDQFGALDGDSDYGSSPVDIYGGRLENRTITVSAINVPYRIFGERRIREGSNVTIEPGATLAFTAGAGLIVEGDATWLNAEGTAEDVITFTGTTDGKGFWKGIGFNSSNTNNVLKQAVIEDAGSEKLFAGAAIDGVAGLQLKGGSTLTLQNSTVQNNSNNGLHADENVELRRFSSNRFTNNETASLHLHIDQFGALDEDSAYGSRVDIYGGRLVNRTITVSAIEVPYRIFGERSIREGSDVTVKAGATFEFASSAALLVEGDATVFKAQGTDSENIIFTGTSETTGFWDGVGIKSDNANNEMTHVTVEYGGKETIFAPQDDPGNIQILSGQLTLTQSLIQESASFGLTSSNGASDVTESGNTYQANASGARNF